MKDMSRGQARQYARALLQIAREGGDDEPPRLLRDLRELVALVGQSETLRAALGGAGVTLEQRGRVLGAVVDAAGGSETLKGLVRLLALRDHLGLLPSIAAVFGDMVNAVLGIVPVEATLALPLSDAQEGGLVGALRQVCGREVELATRVEPAVLGGLRVKMQGRTYDGTVRARLRALRRSLASGS